MAIASNQIDTNPSTKTVPMILTESRVVPISRLLFCIANPLRKAQTPGTGDSIEARVGPVATFCASGYSFCYFWRRFEQLVLHFTGTAETFRRITSQTPTLLFGSISSLSVAERQRSRDYAASGRKTRTTPREAEDSQKFAFPRKDLVTRNTDQPPTDRLLRTHPTATVSAN